MKQIRPQALINLDNYEKNIKSIQNHLEGHVLIMAVVKADAYGHGALDIALKASALGVKYFGVASIDEALELRHGGLKGDILVFGQMSEKNISLACENDISITLSVFEMIPIIEKLDKALKLHIKVDTGISRDGFYMHDEKDIKRLTNIIDKVYGMAHVSLEGIYTHFAVAGANRTYTDMQYTLFDLLLENLKNNQIKFGLAHCANSAATISNIKTHKDMVRIGLASYGINPIEGSPIKLYPVMSVVGFIVQIKSIKDKDFVGYGNTFQTHEETKIGIVNMGYADGINRLLSNKGYMLVNGKKAPVIGKISMDSCVLNLSGIQVTLYDEVVFIGHSMNQEIKISDISKMLNTIDYEILCGFGQRIKKRLKSKQKL